MDAKYRGRPSFINTGPVHWVDKESTFAPSIFVDFNVILGCIPEIEDRLNKLSGSIIFHPATGFEKSAKALLFFICDLVSLISPATIEHITFYITHILRGDTGFNIETLASLAVAMRILGRLEIDGRRYYYRLQDRNRTLIPFTYRKRFEIPVERAKLLSILERIDGARHVLMQMGRVNAG